MKKDENTSTEENKRADDKEFETNGKVDGNTTYKIIPVKNEGAVEPSSPNTENAECGNRRKYWMPYYLNYLRFV